MTFFTSTIASHLGLITRGVSITPCIFRQMSSAIASVKVSGESLDPQQVKLLEEMCIVVDSNDKPIEARSKKDCHLMTNIKKGMVHRAFSVFLFNGQGELLIQQRSDAKITFPGHFTNTCCSHPLHIPEELEGQNALGVKRAAQRRLNIELGIPLEQLQPTELEYLTRIQYMAPSSGQWGESEIDYILVAQKDLELKPNPNEIKSLHYVSRDNLKDFLNSVTAQGHQITPWFQLIANSFLENLWKNIHNFRKLQDHKTIHRL